MDWFEIAGPFHLVWKVLSVSKPLDSSQRDARLRSAVVRTLAFSIAILRKEERLAPNRVEAEPEAGSCAELFAGVDTPWAVRFLSSS